MKKVGCVLVLCQALNGLCLPFGGGQYRYASGDCTGTTLSGVFNACSMPSGILSAIVNETIPLAARLTGTEAELETDAEPVCIAPVSHTKTLKAGCGVGNCKVHAVSVYSQTLPERRRNHPPPDSSSCILYLMLTYLVALFLGTLPRNGGRTCVFHPIPEKGLGFFCSLHAGGEPQ